MRQAGTLGLALLIAGCAAAPKYRAPEVAVPRSFSRADAGGQGPAGDLSRFWSRLGDPLLDELVDESLANNRDLRSAGARLRQARAARNFARADRFPTLGFSGSVTRSRSGIAAASGSGGGASATRSLYDAGFDASWEADVFGGKRRAQAAAQADLEASAAELAATQVSLVAEVALSYVEVRSFQARLRIAHRNLETQSETLQIANWRAMAGLVTSLDVEQARRNREETRALIPPLERDLAEAEHRLAVLLGEPPGALRERLAERRPIPVVADRVLVGIPAETLKRRPDVRAAERRLAAERARIGQARAERFPTLSLSGTLGLEALVGSPPRFAYSLAAGLAGPLLDAGRIRHRIELQRAIGEEALANYDATVLTALEEVDDALVGVASSRSRRESLEAALDAARDAAELARAQYAAGLIDFLTVLDAERSVLSVEDDLAETRAETTSAVVRLYKALGGGWSPERGAPEGLARRPTRERAGARSREGSAMGREAEPAPP